MTLSFTQTINGKPNYFPQKIWMSLPADIQVNFVDVCYTPYFNKYGKTIDMMNDPKPKLHTIRQDEKDRWKAGKLIHPVVKPEGRFSAGFQFAPTIPCVSTQRIDIDFIHSSYSEPTVTIDDRTWYADDFTYDLVVKQLAINDGFESAEAFFDYFKDGIDNGKLIHWTDLKY